MVVVVVTARRSSLCWEKQSTAFTPRAAASSGAALSYVQSALKHKNTQPGIVCRYGNVSLFYSGVHRIKAPTIVFDRCNVNIPYQRCNLITTPAGWSAFHILGGVGFTRSSVGKKSVLHNVTHLKSISFLGCVQNRSLASYLQLPVWRSHTAGTT